MLISSPKSLCKRCNGKGRYKCGGCGGVMKACYPKCVQAARGSKAPANRAMSAPSNKMASVPIVKNASDERVVKINGVETVVSFPHRVEGNK